ncbi:hypothetical protein [Aeromicrobium sp.]|uniref:hypothetical protein n=1 Tax=Aeromicrobium sp. TaxID=1871063 RepID=UPI0019ADC010|nr:hypothetical protein [Aeromicrobium sp.]MBC7633886.1 hypothetical protein [Aeromicrobium sp.]
MSDSVKGAIRNPLNPRQLYYREEGGTVMVMMGSRWGRFHGNGEHIDGPLFEADPELCVWVASPRPSSHHRLSRIVEMSGER